MTPRQWTYFVILTFVWGASFLWIKIAVREAGPVVVVTIRLVMALLALLPFLIRARPGFPRGARLWGMLTFQGMISTALPWLLIVWAEQYIDSALATVLNGTVPLFTIIAAHFWLHDDRMTPRRVLGLLLGFSGIVVLVLDDLRSAGIGPEDASSRLQLLGQGAMLLSAAFYAVSNVFARAKFRNLKPVYQAFYTMLAADAVMWLSVPIIEPDFALPVQSVTWIAIAWLGMLGAGISYLLFYNLLHAIGPTRVATVTYTIPVVGVTLGVVFLGEALTWQLVVGTLLIVSGVAGVTRR